MIYIKYILSEKAHVISWKIKKNLFHKIIMGIQSTLAAIVFEYLPIIAKTVLIL